MTIDAKGLGQGPPVQDPHETLLPGWRAACLAYRREWRKGHSNGGLMWRETWGDGGWPRQGHSTVLI